MPILRMLGFATLAVLLMAAGCASTTSKTSNQWRIHVDGGARSAGLIALEVLGVGRKIAHVDVPIVAGTGENDVARRIRDELQLSLDPGQYSVMLDDGEEVRIRRRPGVDDFEIRLVDNTVEGTRLRLERD